MKKLNKITKTRYILYIGLLIVFYNEFISYWLSYMYWPQVHDKIHNDPIRVLLVADPQIIGDNDEPWYQSFIAKWDSDRYLRNTYMMAHSYVQPNVIIFLGDLFDEGLKATDNEYDNYYKRFSNIFKLSNKNKNDNILRIYLAGDNDIGGEYHGDRTLSLDKRFQDYFGSLIKLNKYKYLSFLQLDLDYTSSFYFKPKQNKIKYLMKNSTNELAKYMILLNHMSIISRDPDELNKLVDDINPALIIKGDSHKFYIAKYDLINNKIEDYLTYESDSTNLYYMNLKALDKRHIHTLYEISIPTCSYRMGVPNMGYGMMTINDNGNTYVSILWLPSRFTSLFMYIIYTIFILFLIFFRFLFKLIFRLLINN